MYFKYRFKAKATHSKLLLYSFIPVSPILQIEYFTKKLLENHFTRVIAEKHLIQQIYLTTKEFANLSRLESVNRDPRAK